MPAGDILVVGGTSGASGEALAVTLSALGYRLRTVATGCDALVAAEEDLPDAVLLSPSLPDIDGYTVCERMKASELLKDVPVIFRSRPADPLDRVRALAAGGADFIAEPCASQEAAGRIDAHAKVHALERQLKAERALLEDRHRLFCEAESLRDGLVQVLMHDLRSPLTAMMANLELLQHDAEKVGGEVARLDLEQLAEARRMSAAMARMISDMLAVGRFEAGTMRLNSRSCDLREVLREALAVLARDATRTDAPDAPMTVWCDADLVRRVLTNLVANALRFTARGRAVPISVRALPAQWRVEVTDEGPPLPPELHELIFDKRGQIDARVRKRLGSTGLSLPFCKLAIEGQGGAIGVYSDGARGRTFWIALPSVPGLAQPNV